MRSTNFRQTAFSVLLTGVLSVGLCADAHSQNDTLPSAPTATTSPASSTTAAAPIDRLKNTQADNTLAAWDMLTAALQDDKHPETRISALAALGTLGRNARSVKLIASAFSDPDLDVRTAAVLAAGQAGDRNLTTNLHAMLDDKEPQVVFAAATTLWKMKDRSGEDILLAVVNGDRKATAGIKDSTIHRLGKDLHSPATLVRFGALQGASILLGPFGMGISAYEYMRKNGGDAGRLIAIEQISQEHTGPIRAELIAALEDKDADVRAAAAKALGSYHEKAVSDALLPVFDDAKAPVHLIAAAAYLRSTEVAARRRPRAKRRATDQAATISPVVSRL